MQLTDEQVKAAEAQGRRFVEASEAQVRQFSMQRRVFQIDGKPYLAARSDGFYETAGTLAALVSGAAVQQDAEPPSQEVIVPEHQEQAEPAPATVETTPPDTAQDEVTPQPRILPVGVPQSSVVLEAMKVIARGYARGHSMNTAELTTLLTSVHRTLNGLPGSRS